VDFAGNQRIFLSRLIAQPDLKKGFGAELKRRRMENGISQERLAELADLHRTYISAVESGKRNLTLESIQRLARALGATVGSFFASVERSPGDESTKSNFRPGIGSPLSTGAILLVEDDPKDVEFTLAAFRAAKVANPIHVAGDGATALEILTGTDVRARASDFVPPQVVLLDLHLPKIHGLEVLRRIKADRRLKQMPVIVLTASRSDRDIQEALRLGANAYLTKPVDFHRFADVTPKLSLRWALL
jgi:CheY-like chemotaxis protein/DNA-binding XRE family transcriptional regulator